MRQELRWGVGCLVGSVALTGMVIFVLLVAATLQPPAWVQVVLGVALVVGGGLLTWLVTSALGQSRQREASRPRPVPSPDEQERS